MTTESVRNPICWPAGEDCKTVTRLGWLAPATLLLILLPTNPSAPCAYPLALFQFPQYSSGHFKRRLLMDVASHLSLAELQRRQRVEKDAYVARNLQIIVLALQGWTAPAVSMAVGLTRRVVQQRVYEYNEQGLAALLEQRGAPARPLLSEDEERAFRQRVEAGPRPEDEVCSLRGKDFQRI